MPKISTKFERGHPNTGGEVKMGDFWQITRYNSKMVQDIHIVSMKFHRNLYALYLIVTLPVTLGDL